jgi:diguanylate cyclase (GGDEF)-like protein
MKNILILEDDVFYCKNLKKELEREFQFKVNMIHSSKDLNKIDLNSYDLIISDIFLDEHNGHHIEKLSTYNIPIILITAFPDLIVKEENIRFKNVIDFILKTDSNKFTQIVDKIKILNYLKTMKILIVDDSKTSQFITLRTIRNLYPMSEQILASNGEEALEIIEKNEKIKLILTDYEMPKMDGITFTKKVRSKYSFDEKIVIAISGKSQEDISARFLKVGANDFLNKHFNQEELKCRIDNSIKILMLLDNIKDMAYKDKLTNLYNRRYFYDVAKKTFDSKLKEHFEVSIIMLDIDHFKKLNDAYGHQIGDLALQTFATLVKNNLRENNIIARYGGEEFIILLVGCDEKKAFMIAEEKIRKEVEKLYFKDNHGNEIHFTVSAGVSSKGDTLEEMIKNADAMLYKAKEKRNRVESEFLHNNKLN